MAKPSFFLTSNFKLAVQEHVALCEKFRLTNIAVQIIKVLKLFEHPRLSLTLDAIKVLLFLKFGFFQGYHGDL
jgi:hypothetical protein